jgi:hypothetical protein
MYQDGSGGEGEVLSGCYRCQNYAVGMVKFDDCLTPIDTDDDGRFLACEDCGKVRV